RLRLDQLEAVLGTVAESLDVREVFPRLSAAAQPLLAHDLLVLTELDVPSRAIRVVAMTGDADTEVKDAPVTLTAEEIATRKAEYEIVRDIQLEIAPTSERQRLVLGSGMRSWLRVPVWVADKWEGSLSFFHREPARYDAEDVEVAVRLADRVALMLS